MTPEEQEAAIIRRVYASTYSHAENVLRRLRELETLMPTEAAIDVIYHEVTATE